MALRGSRVSVAPAGTAVEAGRRPTILSWRRLLVCLVGGVLAAGVPVVAGVPEVSVLVGWTVAAGGLLTWVWRISWPRDWEATKRLAEEEGRTHVTDAAVLGAAVVSLAAVAEALVRSSAQDAVGVATVVLGVLVVILSWALVNTVFALKYARRYYSGGDGGIDFGQEEPPAYSDFAYVAFTVGMSFAVPDTQLVDTSIRKVALGHALLSFLFGTVVIAVAVNLVTNLGQQG
ncbi:conserved membrane protein of unknown function [Modestobacter italicus]|uniref:DUF1345 domain-containing protein n=1 Tax=Modestobacter italicus (strain DSM 44449 / CECT 9708 / BC 501) TaxID=2732864 RepID=I4EVN3_MODI5|nr:conserved membrane protein of unknown function [Modestobacter marinus]